MTTYTECWGHDTGKGDICALHTLKSPDLATEPPRGEQALQAVTRAWFEALDVLQALVQDACIQTGPDAWDLEVDRESLIQVCAAARTLLYKYRGEV